MPLLQLAIDILEPERVFEIARETEKYFDILEAGTPLIKYSGVEIIRKLKKQFPKKLIFADLKIIDAGRLGARMAFQAGADMVSVCGQASDETIRETLEEAKRQGKLVMIDLIGARDKLSRAEELRHLRPDYFCIHTGLDEQAGGKSPLEFLDIYVRRIGYPYAIAGGIKPEDIVAIKKFGPAIIIVGGYVTRSDDPVRAASLLREAMEGV